MKCIDLGEEHDRKLTAALKATLKSMGAKRRRRWWGLGGSQELTETTYDLNGEKIIVETETYMGLKMRGPAAIVDAVAEAVAKRLGR